MDIGGIDYLGLGRVLKRGSGKVLADHGDALLVRDCVSGALMLACDDAAAGIALLDRYAGQDCRLLMTVGESLGQAAFERYGFDEKLTCRQFAYYGEKPQVPTDLTVRCADEGDLGMLTEHYRMISPEELKAVVRRRSVYIGFHQGRPVGFIGEHLEGSMGLLYVFPEFRRRGFGTALETFLTAKIMDRGDIPFGQVEKDNLESIRLQKRLGMTVSDRLMLWMWKA